MIHRMWARPRGLAAVALCACLAATARAADIPDTANTAAQAPEQVKVESVEVALSAVGPVVLLKAAGKAIPVFVDPTVAESIQAALTRKRLPRPLSHDLMRSILESYGGKVTQVVVTLRGSTYYGALTVELQGTTRVFDSRSSDAVALAIHFAAPILVGRDLLEKAGRSLADPPGSQRL